MPELPEVETIRRGLHPLLFHKKVKNVTILCEKSFIGDKNLLKNSEIKDITRRGKCLIFHFKNFDLLTHLRMTGQLIWVGRERFAGGHPNENFLASLPNSQTRIILDFDDGRLFFNDKRKFGFMKVLKPGESDPFLEKLGPEPWSETPENLYKKLQKHPNSSVKSLLLNQSILAGLGNIYADETLFFAKIDPRRPAQKITKKDAENLLEGAKTVMERSLKSGGSTLKNYLKSDGSRGDYLDLFAKVFNKTDTPCPNCGAKIKKIKVAGRGTHLCERCQK